MTRAATAGSALGIAVVVGRDGSAPWRTARVAVMGMIGAALLYDARGHGRSDGRAMDFGWYGDEDIAGATAFLSDQSDVDADRIAAVGMSMGGEQAIGAAATNTDIRAVVAEGSTNRVASDRGGCPTSSGSAAPSRSASTG